MAGERILVVEDERIIALDLHRRLERFGYEIVGVATNADDAVSSATTLEPDLVLMDIMLNGERDGIDAATDITRLLDIPIVFLTAYADDRTVERAKAAQPVGYVLKPFKERELQTTIEIAVYKAQVTRRLKAQEQILASILSTIHDGLVAYDRDLRIVFLNPVAESLSGWTSERAIGEPINTILDIRDERTDLPARVPFRDVVDGSDFSFEAVFIQNQHGARVSVAGSITPFILPADGNSGGLLTFRDMTHLRRMSEIIEYQASHDSLTGLANRDEFFNQLHAIATTKSETEHVFIYLDIDQFRVVNDVSGHAAGDELLRQVTTDLITVLGGTDHVAGRIGGDEFAILLRNTPLDRGMEVAQIILDRVRRRFIWQRNAFNITASIGLVPISGLTDDGYAILAAADDASYLAKENGGNTIKIYESADYTFLKRRGELRWITRLNQAIEEGRFVLWGQPIARTDGVATDHLEVLIRLKDRDGGLIGPGDFIPAAEKYHLMPAVDRWVLAQAIRILESMRANGRRPLFSINLSAASLAEPRMLDYIVELLRTSSVEPQQICLEITETAAISNMSHATHVLNTLRAEGVSFALDDFGNGFSSFSYLKRLPVDYLKIDGSFVRDMAEDPIDRALVEAVNTIGHAMGLQTIAEYVKDDATRSLLTAIGVDFLQGYEIAKPAPIE